MDQTLTCLWCKSPELIHLHVQNEFYHQCKNCDFIFLSLDQRLTADSEKARYDLHHNEVTESGYQAFVMPLKIAIENKFSPTSLGLDYGSGKDSAISYLLEKQGYQIKRYDPFFRPNKTVLALSSYDFIIVCEVAEHFYNPEVEFRNLSSYLKPNGVIFVMTSLVTNDIDFATWYYRRDVTHVCFYSEKTFALKFKTTVLAKNLVELQPLFVD